MKDDFKIRCKVVRILDDENDEFKIIEGAKERLNSHKSMRKVFKANDRTAYIRGTRFHRHFEHIQSFDYKDITMVEKSLKVPNMVILTKDKPAYKKVGVVFEKNRDAENFLRILHKERRDLNIHDIMSGNSGDDIVKKISTGNQENSRYSDEDQRFGSDDMEIYNASDAPSDEDFMNEAQSKIKGIVGDDARDEDFSIDKFVEDILSNDQLSERMNTPVATDPNDHTRIDDEYYVSPIVSGISSPKARSILRRQDTPEAVYRDNQPHYKSTMIHNNEPSTVKTLNSNGYDSSNDSDKYTSSNIKIINANNNHNSSYGGLGGFTRTTYGGKPSNNTASIDTTSSSVVSNGIQTFSDQSTKKYNDYGGSSSKFEERVIVLKDREGAKSSTGYQIVQEYLNGEQTTKKIATDDVQTVRIIERNRAARSNYSNSLNGSTNNLYSGYNEEPKPNYDYAARIADLSRDIYNNSQKPVNADRMLFRDDNKGFDIQESGWVYLFAKP